MYKGNILRYNVFSFLMYFYLWMPISVVFLQQKGMSLSEIGIFDGMGFVISSLAEIPTGAIADRFGRKTSLILSAIIYSIGMFFVTAKIMTPIFIIGYLFWFLANSLLNGANIALVYDSLKADDMISTYKSVMSKNRSIMQISQAVANLVGAWLSVYNTALCFIICGSLSIIATLVALTFREPPLEKTTDEKEGYFKVIFEATKIVTFNPKVRYPILFAAIVTTFTFVLSIALLQPIALGVKFPIEDLGYILVASQVVGSVTSLFVQKITKNINQNFLLFLYPTGIIVCMIIMGSIHSFVAVFVFVLLQFYVSLSSPTLSDLMNQAIPSAQRATILSFQTLIWTILVGLLEILLFHLIEVRGNAFTLYVASALLAVTAIPLFFLWRKALVTKSSHEVNINTI